MAENTEKQAKQQYTYCKVRFSNSRFELSYIIEDESVQAGDFVKVPFGRENEERVGLVTQVISCTSEDAPYPPEKTKYVLEKTEQPEDWDVPKKKKTRERAEPQARHIAKEVTIVLQEPQARFEPRKKKGIAGKCIAFALLVTLVFIIGAIKPDENADSVESAPPQTSYIDPEREEEIMEQVLKEHYSGEMPIEGMPMRALKYTSLGEPDEKVLCRDYDKMDENHKQITVRWYRKDGSLLASGLCFQLKSDQEMWIRIPGKRASRQYRGKAFVKTTITRRICGKIIRATTMTKTKPGTSGMTTEMSRMMNECMNEEEAGFMQITPARLCPC